MLCPSKLLWKNSGNNPWLIAPVAAALWGFNCHHLYVGGGTCNMLAVFRWAVCSGGVPPGGGEHIAAGSCSSSRWNPPDTLAMEGGGPEASSRPGTGGWPSVCACSVNRIMVAQKWSCVRGCWCLALQLQPREAAPHLTSWDLELWLRENPAEAAPGLELVTSQAAPVMVGEARRLKLYPMEAFKKKGQSEFKRSHAIREARETWLWGNISLQSALTAGQDARNLGRHS